MRKYVFVLSIATLGTIAFADDAPPPGKLSPQCHQAVEQLCPPSGDPRARHDCMVLNHDKLTPDCQAEVKARQDAMKAWRQAHPGMRPNGMRDGNGAPPPPPPAPATN